MKKNKGEPLPYFFLKIGLAYKLENVYNKRSQQF